MVEVPSRKAIAALEGVCALLAPDDPALLAEVSLAWREPAAYVAQFGGRLRERGIDEPEPGLVTIALLDALDARGRLRCVDWRASAEDACFNVGDPLRAAGLDVAALLAWYDPDEWRETDLVSFLKKMGSALAAHGWALVSVDHGADEYPLTVVPFERLAELRSLVKTMGIAGTTLVSFSPSKKPAKLPQPAKARPPRVHDAWTIPADSGFGDSITDPLDGPIVVRAGPPCSCIRLSTWPPSVETLTGSHAVHVAWGNGGQHVIDATGCDADGMRRGAIVLRGDGPERSLADALHPSILVERLFFVGGDTIVVLPTETTYRSRVLSGPSVGADRPLALRPLDAFFRPLDELPPATVAPFGNGSFPAFLRQGRARTGAGSDVLVWEGRGYEWRDGRFVEAYELGPSQTYDRFASAPASDDGFFVVVEGRVREVRQGSPPVDRLPKVPGLHSLTCGPGRSILAGVARRKPSFPCLVSWDPSAATYALVPAAMFGLRADRDAEDVRWSPDTQRLCVRHENELRSVPWELVAALPRLEEATALSRKDDGRRP